MFVKFASFPALFIIRMSGRHVIGNYQCWRYCCYYYMKRLKIRLHWKKTAHTEILFNLHLTVPNSTNAISESFNRWRMCQKNNFYSLEKNRFVAVEWSNRIGYLFDRCVASSRNRYSCSSFLVRLELRVSGCERPVVAWVAQAARSCQLP
jgi:hypothetical protein